MTPPTTSRQPDDRRPRLSRIGRHGGASLALASILAGAVMSGCGATGGDVPAAGAAPPQHAAASTSRAVTVRATEFAFAPARVHAAAGRVRLTLVNAGKVEHELVVLRDTRPATALPVTGGRVSEAHAVGEVSETPAGATRSATLKLARGRYILVCNIAGHYQGGMRGTLTVR